MEKVMTARKTKKKAKKKAAPKRNGNAGNPGSDFLDQVLEDSGAGFENAHADTFAKPALKILQKLSPECDEENDKFIDGADPGMIYNTVTGELSEEVRVNPEVYYTTFAEWIPRSKGGGIVGEYDVVMGQELLRTCTRDEKKRFILPSGNQLARTENFIVKLDLGKGAFEVAIIRMASTQIAKAQRWNSQMNMIRVENTQGIFVKPPTYFYQWTLGTERQSNDQGNWFGWTFERGDMLSDESLLLEIKQDREMYDKKLLTFTPQDGTEEGSENAL